MEAIMKKDRVSLDIIHKLNESKKIPGRALKEAADLYNGAKQYEKEIKCRYKLCTCFKNTKRNYISFWYT